MMNLVLYSREPRLYHFRKIALRRSISGYQTSLKEAGDVVDQPSGNLITDEVVSTLTMTAVSTPRIYFWNILLIVFVQDHRHGLSIPYHRTSTMYTYRSERSAMERGYGGFPSPSDIVVKLLRRFFPKLQQRLSRTVTIPNTATYTSHGGNTVHAGIAGAARGVGASKSSSQSLRIWMYKHQHLNYM